MKLPDSILNQKIILTMPVFNEINVIETVVKKNFEYINRFPKGKLLVSEDGSTDGTKEVLKKLQKKLGFILYSSDKRKGARQGQINSLFYALKKGADIILFTDSDYQHDPNDFNKLLKKLKKSDIAVGIKKNRQDPTWRRIGSIFWNLYIEILFHTGLHDINCGFRVIKRSVLVKLLKEIKTLSECDMTELSIRAHASGFVLDEAHVSHFPREGEPKAWNPRKIFLIALNVFREALLLRIQLWKKSSSFS